MKNHSLFVVSLYYKRWSAMISSLLIILRDEIDFSHCLDFVSIIWLVWDSASNRFLCDFSLRFLSSSFNCLSSFGCRLDHCGTTISHYPFSVWNTKILFVFSLIQVVFVKSFENFRTRFSWTMLTSFIRKLISFNVNTFNKVFSISRNSFDNFDKFEQK
jgi:hypothetical protein